MTLINTPYGQAELTQQVNDNQYIAKFTQTGGLVISTVKDLESGKVKDPLRKQRARWKVSLKNSESFSAISLKDIANETGVHLATVQKVAQGTRNSDIIESITRI